MSNVYKVPVEMKLTIYGDIHTLASTEMEAWEKVQMLIDKGELSKEDVDWNWEQGIQYSKGSFKADDSVKRKCPEALKSEDPPG